VLDYHLHLWEHSRSDVSLHLQQVVEYCERASAAGVVEVALTEHLFRFVQATGVLGRWWEESDDSSALQASMAEYWDHHARSDLDAYVETVLEAKRMGLPVVMGLEVDYYRGRMDDVEALLAGYPFDVLLGSVHWIGTWRFDDLSDETSMEEWSVRDVDATFDGYADALAELADTRTCDVLAHPDLVKVTGQRPGRQREWWDRMAEITAESGMAAEISSAGWRKPVGEPYPAEPLLARMAAHGVPFTTASDAHRHEHVADRAPELRAMLGRVGISHLQAYRRRQPHVVPLVPAAALPGVPVAPGAPVTPAAEG